MKTFILTFQKEIEAEDENDALNKLFEDIENETNESCENYFYRNIKIEENKTQKLL